MRLAEFTALVGENPRQVRYLISEGLMPAPDGVSSAASYGDRHAEAVRRYQALRAEGMRPGQIKAMLQGERRLDAAFAPGVRLVLDPGVPGWSDPDPALLAAWVGKTVEGWLGSPRGDAADETNATDKETGDAVG